jgi:hypothetical protein
MGANAGWDDEPTSSWRAPEGFPAPGRVARSSSSRSRWRRRAAFALAGVAAVAVAMGVVAHAPVTRTFRPAHQATPAPGRPAPVGAVRAGRGYAFPLPAGWRDQTRQLAGAYRGVRPVQVLTGRATSGFVADLSVLQQPVGSPPSLQQLAASLPGRLRSTLGAVPAGDPRNLLLGGAGAVAADWTLTQDGRPLRVRQVACYHHGAVWFLTFTARAEAFPADVVALDQAVRSWRWTG